jgi:hypothetical protein
VQVLGQLKHPNIVTIHDTGVASGCHHFVKDYISGQPLDVHMANGPRSIDETLKLFLKICEAVNAAHLRGVIHRDLKPGNIRVDAEGEPYVLDFGLAKVATSDAGAAAMTMTGQFVGSLPWAALADDVGTAFSYQGVLKYGDAEVNEPCDFLLRLFDAPCDTEPCGGTQVGSDVVLSSVDVVQGNFNLEPDFGPVFGRTARWMETSVRLSASGDSFQVLLPRRRIVSTPVSQLASRVEVSAIGNQAPVDVTALGDGRAGIFSNDNPLSSADALLLSTMGTGYALHAVAQSSGFAGFFEGRGHLAGDVGIGTTNPTMKLDVRGGNMGVDGDFRFTGTNPRMVNAFSGGHGSPYCIPGSSC